ncbi:MAG: class I SAM-dependent RNA methyltransferase, partial [Thiothrix sp.]|nr:class I SAM-dependent RNA methyltransferase [Thiothrix sp.]
GEAAYRDFKQGILASFVGGMGLEPDVLAPLVEVGMHARRRAELKIACTEQGVRIGFYAKASHQLVDVTVCSISDPAITRILPVLRRGIAALNAPERCTSISLTALDAGLDAVMRLSHPLSREDTEKLIACAQECGIIRLHTQLPEAQPLCLYDTGGAIITFGGVAVALPAGAFMQASAAGEQAITRVVLKHLQGCARVADLYAGCGTYSFPLSQQSQQVSAYEGAQVMVTAMQQACGREGLRERVQARLRDLYTHPLTAQELNAYDGLVINPPRNGALPQVQQIAHSTVGRVVMVSCDPATFKRDARCLLESGYRLIHMVPIDQFTFSRHLELVAVFERDGYQ